MNLIPLTGEELTQLATDISVEQKRRADVESIPATMTDLNQTFLAAQGTAPGADWRQPAGAHDAYPEGWQVNHVGKVWESLTPFNVWEPGVSSWREVVPPAGPPAAWVQPTGAQDAYNIGDRVTFGGQVYESVIDANTWSPTAYPAGWKLIPA